MKSKVGKPVCVAPAGAWCGEGPVWHEGEQALYWTDINRFLIHRYDPESRAMKSWFFEEPVCAMTVTERDDTLGAVLGSRVMLWEPATDRRREQGFHVPGWPKVRSNDSRPDPAGRLWLATMRNNVNSDGSPGDSGGKDGTLYRIDPDGAVSEWKSKVGIGNTLAWSPDRSRFYFVDTSINTVYAYDYDVATGVIANERVFFSGFNRGVPDGSTVDSEGYLWNCRHGGGCIVRLSPEGEVDQVVEIPAVNVTSCTFGGADRRTLYVTSASLGAPAGDRLGGSLFALETEVAGQPENRLKLKTYAPALIP